MGRKRKLVGYIRVSRADKSQEIDLQRNALLSAGVGAPHIYDDVAFRVREDRPGLSACLKALRKGDTLLVWRLDRLGRDLRHLVNTMHDLSTRGIGFKVLTGLGAGIDTTTPRGMSFFSFFAALEEFEQELIRERTEGALAAAKPYGHDGGRPFKMTAAKLKLVMASMGKPDTNVTELCAELGISRWTLYRHVDPKGTLRPYGEVLQTSKDGSVGQISKE